MDSKVELPGLCGQQLADSEFMSVDQKRRVLKQWERFLQHGCRWEDFTKPLYHHLTGNCSFIAHYNRAGFYATYFERGEDTAHFLSQFDERNGSPPLSVEYGMTYWATGDYEDINKEMIRIAGKYIPTLIHKAQREQRQADIAEARRLLAKHRIALKIPS